MQSRIITHLVNTPDHSTVDYNPYFARMKAHFYFGAIVFVTRFGAIIVNDGGNTHCRIGDGWDVDSVKKNLANNPEWLEPLPYGFTMTITNTEDTK